MTVHRKFTVIARGDSEEAYEDALREALASIQAGNTSGANSNDEGGYYFNSTNIVHESELPA